MLGPGTLYTSIRRMEEAGLIAEVVSASSAAAGRVYRITAAGGDAARSEAERLARDVAHLRRLLLLTGEAES